MVLLTGPRKVSPYFQSRRRVSPSSNVVRARARSRRVMPLCGKRKRDDQDSGQFDDAPSEVEGQFDDAPSDVSATINRPDVVPRPDRSRPVPREAIRAPLVGSNNQVFGSRANVPMGYPFPPIPMIPMLPLALVGPPMIPPPRQPPPRQPPPRQPPLRQPSPPAQFQPTAPPVQIPKCLPPPHLVAGSNSRRNRLAYMSCIKNMPLEAGQSSVPAAATGTLASAEAAQATTSTNESSASEGNKDATKSVEKGKQSGQAPPQRSPGQPRRNLPQPVIIPSFMPQPPPSALDPYPTLGSVVSGVDCRYVVEDTKKRNGIDDDDITPSDVLCGRGGMTNQHMGNMFWRRLADYYRRDYMLAKKKQDKGTITYGIVGAIRKNHGRFLKKDNDLDLWFEIGDEKAKEKTSQLMREGLPLLRGGRSS